MQYEFVRPRDAASEFKIWQAARATAAAPLYFKSFLHLGTAYTDGAVHHNCPAVVAESERKRIWGEISDWQTDFLLSLGTGLSSAKTKTHALSTPISPSDTAASENLAGKSSLSGIRYGLKLAFKIIDDQLNCERIWKDYVKETTAQSDQRPEDRRRSMRLNVEFSGDRPSLDGVENLDMIVEKTTHAIQNDLHLRNSIHEAAHRLVASSFYFEVSNRTHFSRTGNGFTCTGKMLPTLG